MTEQHLRKVVVHDFRNRLFDKSKKTLAIQVKPKIK